MTQVYVAYTKSLPVPDCFEPHLDDPAAAAEAALIEWGRRVTTEGENKGKMPSTIPLLLLPRRREEQAMVLCQFPVPLEPDKEQMGPVIRVLADSPPQHWMAIILLHGLQCNQPTPLGKTVTGRAGAIAYAETRDGRCALRASLWRMTPEGTITGMYLCPEFERLTQEDTRQQRPFAVWPQEDREKGA